GQSVLFGKLDEEPKARMFECVWPEAAGKYRHAIRILLAWHVPGEQPLAITQFLACKWLPARFQTQLVVLTKQKALLWPIKHGRRHQQPIVPFPDDFMDRKAAEDCLGHCPDDIRPVHSRCWPAGNHLFTQLQRP